MKLLKHIMKTALIAALGLTMMTACGGGGEVPSTVQESDRGSP